MSNLDYMDKLLDGVEVEWKTLADITLPTSNIKWRDVEHTHLYIDLSSVSIETKKIIETTEVDATNAPSRAQKIIQEGDVIFATTRPTQMRYCLIDDIYSGQIASTGYCVLRPQISKVLPKWILYCIASKRFKSHVENKESGAAYPAISDTKIKAFEIPVPPLNIQAEIIQILDTFTELTAELTAELVARKQQYGYYHDQFLTFNDNEVEWKTLEDISVIFDSLHQTPQYTENGLSMIRVTNIKGGLLDLNDALKVSNETFKMFTKRYAPQKFDLVMSRVGSYGNVSIVPLDNAVCMGQNTVVIHPLINKKFLYYVLSSEGVKSFIEKNVAGGSQKTLSLKSIKAIPIPIPSEDQQTRIVTILDKFDALTASLTEGLPREIALRQQQYEYYRELLLSFPKPEVANHD